jgi:hypothetical protein
VPWGLIQWAICFGAPNMAKPGDTG